MCQRKERDEQDDRNRCGLSCYFVSAQLSHKSENRHAGEDIDNSFTRLWSDVRCASIRTEAEDDRFCLIEPTAVR
jgi:hypothetical protein